MNVCGNQVVVCQQSEIVRLVSGRMLIDNWATAATLDLFTKKRKGVKEAA